MKREIKFRGLFINKSKWVYGFYTNMIGKSQMVLYDGFPETEEQEFNQHFICQTVMPDYSGWSAKECHRFIPVIPETVSQYTGRKTKNGKEIYEGDWCRAEFRDSKQITVVQGVIIMDDYAWCLKDIYDKIYPINTLHQFEIIGNIYENPNLLASQ